MHLIQWLIYEIRKKISSTDREDRTDLSVCLIVIRTRSEIAVKPVLYALCGDFIGTLRVGIVLSVPHGRTVLQPNCASVGGTTAYSMISNACVSSSRVETVFISTELCDSVACANPLRIPRVKASG